MIFFSGASFSFSRRTFVSRTIEAKFTQRFFFPSNRHTVIRSLRYFIQKPRSFWQPSMSKTITISRALPSTLKGKKKKKEKQRSRSHLAEIAGVSNDCACFIHARPGTRWFLLARETRAVNSLVRSFLRSLVRSHPACVRKFIRRRPIILHKGGRCFLWRDFSVVRRGRSALSHKSPHNHAQNACNRAISFYLVRGQEVCHLISWWQACVFIARPSRSYQRDSVMANEPNRRV